MSTQGLFGDVQEYPDPRARERFDSLFGLDHIKSRILTEARVLLAPDLVVDWSTKNHGIVIGAARSVADRPSLLILSGDVGTGKTELAESVGDPIARGLKIGVTLFPMSLSARGKGLVGEMTSLITAAFDEVRTAVPGSARDEMGKTQHAGMLLIDEADALAQSRDSVQMHHEDRAGVNALIRGIDAIRRDRAPILILMCTNRVDSLDPAVLRRAAGTFAFERPTQDQLASLLARELGDVGLEESELMSLASALGVHPTRSYGCTYSDVRQRFVPSAVLDAIEREEPIRNERLFALAESFEPTRPFGEAPDGE